MKLSNLQLGWWTPSVLRFVFVLLYGLLAGSLRAGTDGVFLYRTETGVAFTVTAEGLSRIADGERTVAEGGWYTFNAGPGWFRRGSDGKGKAGSEPLVLVPHAHRAIGEEVLEKTLTVVAADHVRVRHLGPQAETLFDYRFKGEDVLISARVENQHPTASITIPSFGGLRFRFQKEPEGLMPVWHASYLAASGPGLLYPSGLVKIAGSYAQDGQVGVGLSPVWRQDFERSLFMWDWDQWQPNTPERRANRWLACFHGESIPPGGARRIELTLRVSPDTDWRHLLQPYKDQFLSTFGNLAYKPDFRSVGVAHLNRNRESVTPANPYGFHGGFRRIDKAEGVKELCDSLIPGLKRMNAIGLILWGQGGQEPRGEMYRADFDVLPPEVEANWTTLAARFQEAGLRLGVTARPRHLHLRRDWASDLTLDINADDPQHLKILWARFQNMIDRGVTLFYLDSFGSQATDVKIIRYLRERMGPDIQTYAEHACDAMAVYSSFYTETDFFAKGSRDGVTEDQWRPRTDLRFQEIVGWMLGPIPTLSRAYDIHGEIPKDFEPSASFFFRHNMAPMVADWKVNELADRTRAFQDIHVRDNGELRNSPETP